MFAVEFHPFACFHLYGVHAQALKNLAKGSQTPRANKHQKHRQVTVFNLGIFANNTINEELHRVTTVQL